jgi:hypothetical protein
MLEKALLKPLAPRRTIFHLRPDLIQYEIPKLSLRTKLADFSEWDVRRRYRRHCSQKWFIFSKTLVASLAKAAGRNRPVFREP